MPTRYCSVGRSERAGHRLARGGNIIGPASQATLRRAPRSSNLRVVLCLVVIRHEPTARTAPITSAVKTALATALERARRVQVCLYRTQGDAQ